MIHLYTSSNLYTNLVNVCTGLWLLSNEDQVVNRSLEKIIVEGSMSDDVCRMPILMDIWTLYLRYDVLYRLFLYSWTQLLLVFFCSLHLATPQMRIGCCIVSNGGAGIRIYHRSHKVQRTFLLEKY